MLSSGAQHAPLRGCLYEKEASVALRNLLYRKGASCMGTHLPRRFLSTESPLVHRGRRSSENRSGARCRSAAFGGRVRCGGLADSPALVRRRALPGASRKTSPSSLTTGPCRVAAATARLSSSSGPAAICRPFIYMRAFGLGQSSE